MIGDGLRWRVRLSALAEDDFLNILRWTSDRFGDAQARRYAGILTQTVEALRAGSEVPGSRRRDEIAPGLMTLHVTRRGRRGRHLVAYRIDLATDPLTVDILRILHDSMDVSRHVETDGPENP